MPTLVSCDQTGLASDNVRRRLHIIDAPTDKKDPAVVLSIDTIKAFDRLKWPFLWEDL